MLILILPIFCPENVCFLRLLHNMLRRKSFVSKNTVCNDFVKQSNINKKTYSTWNSFNFLLMWTFSTKHSENIPLFFIKITQRGQNQNSNFKLKIESNAPQTISGSIDWNSRTCCMSKVFQKFSSGHEAITSCWPHYDPNFKWRRYPWSTRRRLVIITARLSQTCLQMINCLLITPKTAWHISNTCTCFKKSKRGISVICW